MCLQPNYVKLGIFSEVNENYPIKLNFVSKNKEFYCRREKNDNSSVALKLVTNITRIMNGRKIGQVLDWPESLCEK